MRQLDVACTCDDAGVCAYGEDCAFECERCLRFVPACFGGFDEDGELCPFCDECHSTFCVRYDERRREHKLRGLELCSCDEDGAPCHACAHMMGETP